MLHPIFTIDIPPMFGVMSALVFAFLLGIGISRIKNSSLLKVSEEFNHVISLTIKNVLIPLVPIYILSIFSKLSYNGEIFTTLKSFALVYEILIFNTRILFSSSICFSWNFKERKSIKIT